VPGNHDVDRGIITDEDRMLLNHLDSEEDVEALFADERKMEKIGRRLREYYEFTGRFTGRACNPLRPFRVDHVEVRGIKVGILQLNSSWASGEDEERGRLLVGKVQVSRALEEASGADLRIGLVHHPLEDYLREWALSGAQQLW